ncbi:MAG: RluA family pseudouridine synthase [Nitrospirae bacterium]|jgi:23S rRNA pseudouridine1911/1915/1917 synthase|nr:RluA family pseudouridine synthase [Nitrospirota bacterium]
MHYEFIVTSAEVGQRIDVFLSSKTGITRSQIQKAIDRGDISVNGRIIENRYRVRQSDVILIDIKEKKDGVLIPQNLPIEILFKDEYVIVVNKPAGIVVYPAAGHEDGTLMNAIAYHCGKLVAPGAPLRPGVVHRLDKDTSGVMVIALNDISYYNLTEQFRKRTINRKYIALVYGIINEDKGEINKKIGRSESDRKKMSTYVKRGKEALTQWRVIRRLPCATIIEAKLGTGRTHQIRVHFASIGHPVLGDKIYGKKCEIRIRTGKRIILPRQMLHAEMLGFIHPVSNEYLEFSSPLPDDMAEKVKELEAE